MPIDATIEGDDSDVVSQAIIYFAGCAPSFEPIHGTERLRVRAVGYYQAVGA